MEKPKLTARERKILDSFTELADEFKKKSEHPERKDTIAELIYTQCATDIYKTAAKLVIEVGYARN